MPRIMRASVVLPLPLSPAIVRISGLLASTDRVAPSTAWNFFEENPCRMLKTFIRSSTRSRTDSGWGGMGHLLRYQVAGDPVTGPNTDNLWINRSADIHHEWAARVKTASG